MPTPFPLRQKIRSNWSGASDTTPTNPDCQWRCTGCEKLLGVSRGDRLHLRFARSHEYLVGYPVVATCRGCGTLNQATAPTPR